MRKLTAAQRNLLWKISAKDPIPYLRPANEAWTDGRPDNQKIDRLIARGLLEEYKPLFITITDEGREYLRKYRETEDDAALLANANSWYSNEQVQL